MLFVGPSERVFDRGDGGWSECLVRSCSLDIDSRLVRVHPSDEYRTYRSYLFTEEGLSTPEQGVAHAVDVSFVFQRIGAAPEPQKKLENKMLHYWCVRFFLFVTVASDESKFFCYVG